MRCGVCGMETTVSWVDTAATGKKEHHCGLCYMRRHRPKLILAQNRIRNCNRLINMRSHKLEMLDLAGFERCGFKLYNHCQFRPHSNSKYSDIFTLRFFGHKKCLKLGDYKRWPWDFKECDGIACNYNRRRIGFV